MNFKEIINKTINEGYVGVNNTCNGKCSKCGECCGVILPIDQEDANIIQDYVLNHNISPTRQLLVMANKWQCPYYTGNKEKGCSIYEARPKICRYYKCDKKRIRYRRIQENEKCNTCRYVGFCRNSRKGENEI